MEVYGYDRERIRSIMATVITDALQKALKTNTIPKSTTEAREWFRKKAQALRGVSPDTLLSSSKSTTNRAVPGQLMLFNYDPKHSKTLPFYDRYPVVFPFKTVSDGFYGINMHYLPPTYRGKLMDALYTIAEVDKDDNVKALKLSYDLLASASRFKYFKPCVKHYLNSQVRSRLVVIDPKEWDVAVFLPLQRFEKASVSEVYKHSKRVISKG